MTAIVAFLCAEPACSAIIDRAKNVTLTMTGSTKRVMGVSVQDYATVRAARPSMLP